MVGLSYEGFLRKVRSVHEKSRLFPALAWRIRGSDRRVSTAEGHIETERREAAGGRTKGKIVIDCRESHRGPCGCRFVWTGGTLAGRQEDCMGGKAPQQGRGGDRQLSHPRQQRSGANAVSENHRFADGCNRGKRH